MIKHKKIAHLLDQRRDGFTDDPFFIVPRPKSLQLPLDAEALKDGSASVDLRLGTWFLALRQTTTSLLEPNEPSNISRRLRRAGKHLAVDEEVVDRLVSLVKPEARDNRLARSYHIRFGEDFILHPRNFVLGATLEWLRFPSNLGGYVTGRSSWGRRGLIIATATGVHPGFTGCLTLELANLGDIPIAIRPGMTIGQLFVHSVEADLNDNTVDQSGFACKRAPRLGHPVLDDIAKKLAYASS